MTRAFRSFAPAGMIVLFAACSPGPSPPPSPPSSPTSAPPKASENPPDVRARMPLRPTPPQPESKFPPPQQSEEDEERNANRPSEPDLLHTESAVFLNGEPFPEKRPYDPKFSEAIRTRYVSPGANSAGPEDGSLEHPWTDLQRAFCALEPGDRLLLAAEIYSGSFRIGGKCRSGTAGKPIQVFARHAFLKAAGPGDVLTVERAHWQFWELQIALLDSESAGFVTAGPEAHDIAVDQSHIYEGKGPAVRLSAGSAAVTFSNCHIHQSTGIRIEAGTRGVTLVNNHIHHNRTASVTVGGGAGEPASGVTLAGNRIHNDRGPGLDLADCSGVSAVRNRFSNYRPAEGKGGEAVVVRSGCRGVTLENNTLVEATVGVRVTGSEGLDLFRNFFENRLTEGSVALEVGGPARVRFANNVVAGYATVFRVSGPAGSEARLTAVNNLILDSAGPVWDLPEAGAASLDHNIVSAGRGPLRATIGGGTRELSGELARMPGSRIVDGVSIERRDLGRVLGFSPVDAGRPLDGLSFRGAAPDVGVGER